jgi:hypothetical protein
MSLKKKMSLWDDPNIKAAISQLDPETRLKYKRIGEALYNTIDFCDPETVLADYASHIKFMLRDGMRVEDLTENEKQTFIDVYGLKSLEEYKNESDTENNRCLLDKSREDSGDKKKVTSTKKRGQNVSC